MMVVRSGGGWMGVSEEDREACGRSGGMGRKRRKGGVGWGVGEDSGEGKVWGGRWIRGGLGVGENGWGRIGRALCK